MKGVKKIVPLPNHPHSPSPLNVKWFIRYCVNLHSLLCYWVNLFYLFLVVSGFFQEVLCTVVVHLQQVLYLIKYSAFSFQTDPLEKLMVAYCEFRKLPRSRLKFSFDGDELKGGETPEQLDMENEDVIDVRIK